ncbi:hypothetical protein VTN31DRAFT_7109 [Thermomyces dupontii]|uniref:uncharacterized protein n=1 Tax=Talaromyces thermophilus TaxID=28565 RepID=UPI003743DE60
MVGCLREYGPNIFVPRRVRGTKPAGSGWPFQVMPSRNIGTGRVECGFFAFISNDGCEGTRSIRGEMLYGAHKMIDSDCIGMLCYDLVHPPILLHCNKRFCTRDVRGEPWVEEPKLNAVAANYAEGPHGHRWAARDPIHQEVVDSMSMFGDGRVLDNLRASTSRVCSW